MRFDQIGYWSELKLEIVRKYAGAYSTILSRQQQPSFHHVYIDGFSGSGTHISKSKGEAVQGSPLIALEVEPPFREYFLVDLDGAKVDRLRKIVGQRSDVHIYEGDCNRVLVDQVFPQVQYKDYRRGLCLLDPYGLHLNWQVIQMAGRLKTVDLFLNFPIMDMNRNALWTKKHRVMPENRVRMTSFWGDESWQEVAYQPPKQMGLFGQGALEKQRNEVIAGAFRERLKIDAGFARVAEPLPMRNSQGAIVYYLFFASQKEVADDIVRGIFQKYRARAG
ncbi:MAG TPA: three-Cys-motif partner protein TcmP [Thermoanaerobaculia bacterium]|nr:three-Cys-motif partner protein TcmP [Thermoanaerobaculia bacterium]